MKKLPIGINNLPEMINDNNIYVDKTPYIQKLVTLHKYCFLSRPRRFGKSLLVNTLYHLFTGNEKLFQNLHIHPHWNWSKKYPVLKFDLSQKTHETPEGLNEYLLAQLEYNQQRLEIKCKRNKDAPFCFKELIYKARKKYNQRVVILIDEYDSPLLDHITGGKIGEKIRIKIESFYSVIKGEDENLKFVLLTGVSKFSKVSIFSKLNNLDDIGMLPQYSALCGYTQTELEHCFSDYLQDVDKKELKAWYNGYRWIGESVYNPYNILLFFERNNRYLPYWFETGKTHFLIELLQKKHYHLPKLETKTFTFNELNDFDIDRISFEVLLFQTGYLTVDEEIDLSGEIEYRFSYPNKEVRKTLNYYFLKHYLTQKSQSLKPTYKAFFNHNFKLLEQSIRVLFDNIPCNNYTKNSIANYEGYYASVMYAFLYSLNFEIIPEDTSNKGRIDITVLFTSFKTGKKQVYIFEFKVLKGKNANGSAIKQIKNKNYAAKYQNGKNEIFLVGIEFSKKKRNIVGFEWEKG